MWFIALLFGFCYLSFMLGWHVTLCCCGGCFGFLRRVGFCVGVVYGCVGIVDVCDVFLIVLYVLV